MPRCSDCDGTGVICGDRDDIMAATLCNLHKVCVGVDCPSCAGYGWYEEGEAEPIPDSIQPPPFSEQPADIIDYSELDSALLVAMLQTYTSELKEIGEIHKVKTDHGRYIHSQIGAIMYILNVRNGKPDG